MAETKSQNVLKVNSYFVEVTEENGTKNIFGLASTPQSYIRLRNNFHNFMTLHHYLQIFSCY